MSQRSTTEPRLVWRDFLPSQPRMQSRELVLSGLAAVLGVALADVLSLWALGERNPWFIAPMGASAVLLYAVPSSPLAQPWSVLLGNTLSACIGVLCVLCFGVSWLSGALAVSLAIMAMAVTRSLHPPGGAVALTAVLGGPAIQALGWRYPLVPVLLDSILMVLIAIVLNQLLNRRYPHHVHRQQAAHAVTEAPPIQRQGIARSDIEAVLATRPEILDISTDDLEDFIQQTELQSLKRHQSQQLSGICFADIMTHEVKTLESNMNLQQALQFLKRHELSQAAVLDSEGRLSGWVYWDDVCAALLAHTESQPESAEEWQPARAMMHWQPMRVEDIQKPLPSLVEEDWKVIDHIHWFIQGRHHVVPVVSDVKDATSLIGIVTQTDVLAVWFRLASTRV